MKLDSLRDLYVEQLEDLYSAETQMACALPRLAAAVSDNQLRVAMEIHAEETNQHIQRLDQLLNQLGVEPGKEHCDGMEGLIREAAKLLDPGIEPEVRDAGLIAAAQKIEHYEISGYGTARTYAKILGYNPAAQLLQETLNEERQADEKLDQLAMEGINLEAVQAGAH